MDSPMKPKSPLIGKIINNKYEIEKPLGDGMTGKVFLAKNLSHSDSNSNVAFKELKLVQLGVSRKQALENFKHEFEILKDLKHPNIAQVFDFGTFADNRKYFCTTELITGKEFHHAVQDQSLEVKEMLIVQTLRAINYLHSKGVNHYDIKPQNILVNFENHHPKTVKVIDFGLANFSAGKKTIGTPTYMAPEIIRKEVMDNRADLYSLGVMIYEILTGINPFKDSPIKKILQNHLTITPEPPSTLNPSLPKYWDHIVMRLLEKNPDDRYSQAAHVLKDLNLLSGHSIKIEDEETKFSYLPERGPLISREKEWETFSKIFEKVFLEEENTHHKDSEIIIVSGKEGSGKTRFLNEIKYYSLLKFIPTITLNQLENSQNLNRCIVQIDEDTALRNCSNLIKNHPQGILFIIATKDEVINENWTILKLHNYSKEDLRTYIQNVTGLHKAPSFLVENIYQRTNGNPLFVCEYFKSLLDQDIIFDSDGIWESNTFDDIQVDYDDLNLPLKLKEILIRQYKNLSEEEKILLTYLSFNEEPLTKKSLLFLSKITEESETITQLLKKHFIKESQDQSYTITNPLLAKVIREELNLKNNTSQIHEDLASIHIHNKEKHFYHLGNISDSLVAEKSLSSLAKLYKQQHKILDQLKTLKKLVTINPSIDNYKIDLANCYLEIDQNEMALNYLRSCQNTNDKKLKSKVYDSLIKVHIKLFTHSKQSKHLKEATQLVEEALKFESTKKSITSQLIFRNYQGFIALKQNNIPTAKEIFLKSFEEWEKLSDEEKNQVINNRLLDIYLIEKDFDQAIAVCHDYLEYLSLETNPFEVLRIHLALGKILLYKSYTDPSYKAESLEHYKKCEDYARGSQNYKLLLYTLNELGNIATMVERNNDKALSLYKRALKISKKLNELETAANISYNIGLILIETKKFYDSFPYLFYAIQILESLESKSQITTRNLFLSYLTIIEFYIENKNIKLACEYMNKAKTLYHANEQILSHYVFWYHLKKLMCAFYSGHTEDYEYILTLAKASAKTEENSKELQELLSEFKSKQPIKIQENKSIQSTTFEEKATTSNEISIRGLPKF